MQLSSYYVVTGLIPSCLLTEFNNVRLLLCLTRGPWVTLGIPVLLSVTAYSHDSRHDYIEIHVIKNNDLELVLDIGM